MDTSRQSPTVPAAPLGPELSGEPAAATNTAPSTSRATPSASSPGTDIPREGMRLIRLADAKVNKLVNELPGFIKDAIELALAPQAAALEEARAASREFDPSHIGPILPSAAELFSKKPAEPQDDIASEEAEEEAEEEDEGEYEDDDENQRLDRARKEALAAGVDREDVDTMVGVQRSIEEQLGTVGTDDDPTQSSGIGTSDPIQETLTGSPNLIPPLEIIPAFPIHAPPADRPDA
ncbi:uncharacterized protein LOC132639137 [Lycium barbarum]|uniref:uncharacterized protein LOC132639137 n=1 Tax=Lycium barbarum TaxID=112863 RepID=UPI00293F56CF|nr:uncharacterized protein LOC132639137 [Lycium barbarum]